MQYFLELARKTRRITAGKYSATIAHGPNVHESPFFLKTRKILIT
jgi:hypothetical protein